MEQRAITKSIKLPTLLWHILFWSVYLPLNVLVNCVINNTPLETGFSNAFLAEFLTLPVKITLTYFFFYYIIPLYLDRSQVSKLLALTFGSFVVAMILYRFMLGFVIFPLTQPETMTFVFWSVPGVLMTFFDLFITVTAACIIKMVRLHYKSRELEEQLIREKLQSELNFLRAQTNPHFLFNTLNNLYVLAWKKSDNTADAIMMLSKIMRFVLHECRASRIHISAESKVIKDFIELEKLRYNKRLQVNYQENIDNSSALIAPLLLLPFVENSFKHGASSTTGAVEININLILVDSLLHFSVKNTFEKSKNKPNSNGIGLNNVKRQLELIYPENHKLEIKEVENMFEIELLVTVDA
jgi:two-component system, LytTR family, sensor kinase